MAEKLLKQKRDEKDNINTNSEYKYKQNYHMDKENKSMHD